MSSDSKTNYLLAINEKKFLKLLHNDYDAFLYITALSL